MLTFVTFHSDLSPDTIDLLRRHGAQIGTSSFDWTGAACGHTARTMIDMMFTTASHLHPTCRKVIITDEITPFEYCDDVEVFRCAVSAALPSLGRAVAWVEFLKQAPADSHIIFLDYDILIQSNLEPLFNRKFDVGLTYRTNLKWPINAGIQFLHAGRLPCVLSIYEKVLAIFKAEYREWALWCGDQWSFGEFIQTDFNRDGVFSHVQDGFEFLLLPCDDYNFSADGDWDLSDLSYTTKKVLHFKGRRKSDLFAYWAKYLAPVHGERTASGGR